MMGVCSFSSPGTALIIYFVTENDIMELILGFFPPPIIHIKMKGETQNTSIPYINYSNVVNKHRVKEYVTVSI